jgi:ketosteroid isomerase-like protein
MNIFSRAGAALCATVLAGGCSHTTGGAPVMPHSSTSVHAGAPNPTTSPATSDEDQIRRVVQEFADAYNSENWDAYTELMCTPMRARFTGTVMDYLKKDRTNAGVTTVSVTSVSVNGDTATVHMDSHNEALGSKSVSLQVKREEDGWKICQSY